MRTRARPNDGTTSEKGTKVSFQGESGAYSEKAVFALFGRGVSAVPCRYFSDVFENVQSGLTQYGVVPVENSIEGSVTPVYDLLASSDLKVFRELVLRIDHCLIAGRGVRLAQIRRVYSHPQALLQCSNFLRKMECEVIPSYDTAGSVMKLKEEGPGDSAAIASASAARKYRMNVLATHISDMKDNFTRFFALSQEDSKPTGEDKTSVIFSLEHRPGSLHRALSEFALREINLTKVESRPTKTKPWEYNFYLDFEGHRADSRCAEVLEGLSSKTTFLRIIGSYPKAKRPV